MKNNRLHKEKGFTLTEMLATVLIMSLVMTIVANGMTTVKSVYDKTIAKSDAQMLISLMESELRDELEFADGVKLEEGSKVVCYRDANSGIWIYLSEREVGGRIVLCKSYGSTDSANYEELVAVNDSSIDALKVSFNGITYDETAGLFTIDNLTVPSPYEDGINLAETGELTVCPVNKVEVK